MDIVFIVLCGNVLLYGLTDYEITFGLSVGGATCLKARSRSSSVQFVIGFDGRSVQAVRRSCCVKHVSS